MCLPGCFISCDKSWFWPGHGSKNGKAIVMMANPKTAPVWTWQRLDSCKRTDGDATDRSREMNTRGLRDCRISQKRFTVNPCREIPVRFWVGEGSEDSSAGQWVFNDNKIKWNRPQKLPEGENKTGLSTQRGNTQCTDNEPAQDCKHRESTQSR